MDFDTHLNRKVLPGTQYNNLIPKTTCQSTPSTSGNTDVSIQLMAEVIQEYGFQADALAKVLQQNTLQQTVLAIKNFAYNHFQYKADDDLQQLRSLACSWYDRYNGIDCKSYSILVGSILGALNITYYIRKIKQPGYMPNDFSHVYIIVPINQQNGDLNQGYYTIDGTLFSNNECLFTDKKDLKMQHAKLNGVSNGYNPDFHSLGQLGDHNKTEEVILVDPNFEQGLNGLGLVPLASIALKVLGPKLAAIPGVGLLSNALADVQGKIMSRISQLASNPGQIFAYTGSIFSGCGAYGAFTENEAAAFKTWIANVTAEVLGNINKTMVNGFNNEADFAVAVAKARSWATQLPATYQNILNDGWRSNCTISNLNQCIATTSALRDKTLADLTKYLDENFVIEKESGSETWDGGIYFEDQVAGCRNRSSAVKYIYKIKPGTQLKSFPVGTSAPIALWDFSKDAFPNLTPDEVKAAAINPNTATQNLSAEPEQASILIPALGALAIGTVIAVAMKKSNNK